MGKGLRRYQKITCHLIFDVNTDFTRKARLSIVSRETAHIAFLIAALNDLNVWAAIIGNEYLNANCKKRIWAKASNKFGADEGKSMTIVKALYGLKSSGTAWRNLLPSSIKEMDFTSLKADPDLYYWAQVKKNRENYRDCLLVYVDGILCVSEDMKPIMTEVGRQYRVKENSVPPPSAILALARRSFNCSLGLNVGPCHQTLIII